MYNIVAIKYYKDSHAMVNIVNKLIVVCGI